MKAALMYGANDVRIELTEKPIVEEGGMLLKVIAVGLCGSDIRNLTTDSKNGKYPHIYGHETVGIVSMVGKNNRKYKIGDRLYVYPCTPCLKCESCITGNTHICSNLKCYDQIQGSFAEFLNIPEWGVKGPNIFKIPDEVDLFDVTLSEPLSSVYACQENINVSKGDTVVILGAGPIGCFHSEIAKMRGASTVIMCEINNERLHNSLNFGVDYIINGITKNPVDEVKRLTAYKGADIVICANPSAIAQQQSIYMCKPGGIISYFGGIERGKLVEIDTNYIHYNNQWIYGHYGANTDQIEKAFNLIVNKKINAKKYISKVISLENIMEGIELSKSGITIKIVIDMDGYYKS